MNAWFERGETVDVLWCEWGGDLARGTVVTAVPHEDRYLVSYEVRGKVWQDTFRADEMRRVTSE